MKNIFLTLCFLLHFFFWQKTQNKTIKNTIATLIMICDRLVPQRGGI